MRKAAAAVVVWFVSLSPGWSQKAGDEALGTVPYARFAESDACAACHVDIGMQHRQSLMSQCFTHPWDEIEYFELALPHSEKVPKVAGIRAGCNGCHAPLAFLAGDIPPQRPAASTRANESVSCEMCHSITGFRGEVPFNFNYLADPGDVKQGVRADSSSQVHQVKPNPFLRTSEFCGTCHNEQDPFGMWVKATQLEWKDSPYAEAGIVCQDCHMPPAPGAAAPGLSPERQDLRQHLFHGAHAEGKLLGAAEVRVHPQAVEAAPGDSVRFLVTVFNAKAGHMIPSGSAEERLVWLHVELTDARGRRYHLPVDRKGFPGEDYTVASAQALAYQDIGEIRALPDFPGLLRDGQVPAGDRIFRLPYLDPQGRMTIAQWNTAAFGPDYRLPPLKGLNETYTWEVPAGAPPGPVTVTASLWYSRLVSSVADYLGIPREEYAPVLMNAHQSTLRIRRPEYAG